MITGHQPCLAPCGRAGGLVARGNVAYAHAPLPSPVSGVPCSLFGEVSRRVALNVRPYKTFFLYFVLRDGWEGSMVFFTVTRGGRHTGPKTPLYWHEDRESRAVQPMRCV